jgi:predicted Fe-Mo cluster-binding NifX family protein
MKIVVPTNGRKGMEDTVAGHFGRCSTYTFLDEKGKVTDIIDNTSQHAGGSELPPDLMKRQGANVLLCKELGPRALNLCGQLGIDVYTCQVGTVREIFDLWKNNEIKKAGVEDVCQQHKL